MTQKSKTQTAPLQPMFVDVSTSPIGELAAISLLLLSFLLI
ncbi:MAG: hypothetical protein AAF674_00890 [Pseudomonadota bacterium]